METDNTAQILHIVTRVGVLTIAGKEESADITVAARWASPEPLFLDLLVMGPDAQVKDDDVALATPDTEGVFVLSVPLDLVFYGHGDADNSQLDASEVVVDFNDIPDEDGDMVPCTTVIMVEEDPQWSITVPTRIISALREAVEKTPEHARRYETGAERAVAGLQELLAAQ